MSANVDEYRKFVSARLDRLRRTAYLLCGDWHTADDLVSTALVRLLRHWKRVSTMADPDAYVHRMLVNAWLDERRRPWRRREQPVATLVDTRAVANRRVDERITMLGYLAELPARRRAVLVLRYFCDLSVDDTATLLGVSAGTVKSQTARALDSLRTRLAPAWTEGQR